LRSGDQPGGGFADRQAPAQPGRLVVVIDQHRRAVAVAVQAAEPEGADLLGAAAGVDEQLDGHPHPPGADGLQHVQVLTQPGDDLGGQVPGRLARLRGMRHVPGQQREVIAQARGGLPGPGQAAGADVPGYLPQVPAGPLPQPPADLPGGLLEGQPVQEVLHISASQRRGHLPAVGAGAQVSDSRATLLT
jgi:hypothetical protein